MSDYRSFDTGGYQGTDAAEMAEAAREVTPEVLNGVLVMRSLLTYSIVTGRRPFRR